MDFKPFQDHLEYLGYKSRVEITDTSSVLFAEAAGKPDFNMSSINNLPFLLVRSNWRIENLLEDIDKIINSLNEKSVNISSVWHYKGSDGSPVLGISSAYFGEYDKNNFGKFIDVFLADIQRILANENALRFLRPAVSPGASNNSTHASTPQ